MFLRRVPFCWRIAGGRFRAVSWCCLRGLEAKRLRRLIQFGHDEKLQRLTGSILAENQGMQAVCKKLGFRLQYSPEDHLMSAELEP